MCGNLYSKAIDKFEDIRSGQTAIMTGEILGDGDTTDTTIYEYDVFNRMDTMSDNGKEWTFEYNADGQRVSKSNGSQSLEYIWSGNNIVSEKNENNQSTYFQRGLSLLTMEREQDNFKHYYFKNAHGDVTGVVDTRTNTIKYSYDYDAFGNQILNSATNTNIFSSGYNGEVEDTNPFRYAGEYFDRETVMIYLRNRYYNPPYGRFTQQDPIFDGINWYVYASNNPINAIDPSGLRTYFINGINNSNEDGPPQYSVDFANKLTEKGVKDVRTIGVYNGTGIISGVGQVTMEMTNNGKYADDIANMILEDLRNDPLAEGEELNLIGYSGGGQVVLNVCELLEGKVTVDNSVLIGAPVSELTLNNTGETTMIYSGFDPLSWNVSWYPINFEFAGWIGHSSYFNNENIDKVADIVNKYID